MLYPEENNYPKAVLISTGLMMLFVLICYLLIIGMPSNQEFGTGGIVVNYGTSIEGMGNDYMNVDEPSIDPNANNTPPDKVVPNTSPDKSPSAEKSKEDVVTQDNEDAPSVVNQDKKSTAISTTPVTKESKPVVNPNALYKGKASNTSTGQGDGTSKTPGNQGSLNGDPLSTNYGAGGSGFGDLNLPNRQYVNRPRIEDNGQVTGKIVVKIFVNKNGEIVNAVPGERGTTISDQKLWEKCRIAVMGARFNSLESAPDVQQGTVVFNFKVD
jgi:hypothetical protein